MSLFRKMTLIAAALFGIVIGSFHHRQEVEVSLFVEKEVDDESHDDDDDGTLSRGAARRSVEARQHGTIPTTQLDAAIEEMLKSGAGAVLRPERNRFGEFGYRIIEAGADGRLVVGHLIVAVDGSPLEDSPAGSELLLIALENSGSTIQLKGP